MATLVALVSRIVVDSKQPCRLVVYQICNPMADFFALCNVDEGVFAYFFIPKRLCFPQNLLDCLVVNHAARRP
jgi:hypothetical protein